MKRIFVFILFVSMSSFVYAQQVVTIGKGETAKSNVSFLLGGALEFGGESIISVAFQDGSTQKMYAGQGGTFMAGGSFTFGAKENVELRTTLGFKYLTTKATNVNITLNRIPLRFTGLWKPIPKFYIGGGLCSQMGIKLNAGGLIPNEKFTSGISPTFEIGYHIFSLVITPMKYTGHLGNSYNATAVGLYFVAPLKRRFK